MNRKLQKESKISATSEPGKDLGGIPFSGMTPQIAQDREIKGGGGHPYYTLSRHVQSLGVVIFG